MPYKRKFSLITRSPRARRAGALVRMRAGGKSYSGRIRRAMRSKIVSRKASRNMHRFTRWVATPVVATTNATEYDGAFVWQFSDLALPSEFSSLYDRYKITHIQIRCQLENNPSSTWSLNSGAAGPNQSSNWYPKLWYCPDYDDSGAESLLSLKQRAKTKCITLQPNKQYTINLKPAILAQTYRTELTTGYSPQWGQWIDAGQTDVKHYGLKYCIDNLGLTPNTTNTDYQPKVRFEFKYWFTMKDVR